MTEEIIIDCKYLSKEHSFTNPKGHCNLNLRDCRFVKDCEYKELQRVKQENEKLKEELIDLKWQQESDYQMVEDAETLIYDNDYYKREMNAYRKALEEIREMMKEHPFCDCSCGDDIIDKINEVLGC